MATSQRVKLSKTEAYSLIEDYFSSGELPNVFYHHAGLSENQFYRLRKHYLRDHPHVVRQLGVSLSGTPPRNASHNIEPKPTSDTTSISSSKCGFACLYVSTLSADVSSVSTYELGYLNGIITQFSMPIFAFFAPRIVIFD